MVSWEERSGEDDPWRHWHGLDAQQLRTPSLTSEEAGDEDASWGGSDVSSQWDTGTECGPSLFRQLCERANTVTMEFRSTEQQPGQELLVVKPSTLAVFFLFEDAAKRALCWEMLERTLRVAASMWMDVCENHPSLGDERWCASDGLSLVLLLRLNPALEGHYSVAQFDRSLETFLGCPASRGSRMNMVLRRALRIMYEVVPVDTCVAWVRAREDVLGVCSNSSIAVTEEDVRHVCGRNASRVAEEAIAALNACT